MKSIVIRKTLSCFSAFFGLAAAGTAVTAASWSRAAQATSESALHFVSVEQVQIVAALAFMAAVLRFADLFFQE